MIVLFSLFLLDSSDAILSSGLKFQKCDYIPQVKKNDIKYIEIFNEQKGTKLCPVVCALSYVPALCHHVLALDRAWAFCAHHAGHRTTALSRVHSLFLTSHHGTGPGTGNLSTRMRVFPEREIALAFLTGRLEQRRLFGGASPLCARSWSHPVVAPHRTRLGVVHRVQLLVHPPFVTSRRVTLPCPVWGLFGGLRVRLALALSLHVVTSDHIQSGVAVKVKWP